MDLRPLDAAELTVLALYANGLSTEEIGEKLQLHKSIVQDRLRVAVRKLGAANRVHAVAIAVERKIIKVDEGRK
jgi:LuxR family quorum sensing-dependent transcriptional regulator